MPRWVAGGATPPPQVAPAEGEPLFFKCFFSPFEAPELLAWLQERQAKTLILAGLYTHACIRAAALDAYARGLSVIIPHDGVATTDMLHGEITREYLSDRGTVFAPIAGILSALADGRAVIPAAGCEGERAAIRRAHDAGGDWGLVPLERRADIIRRWRANLAASRTSIVACMIDEIAKPIQDAEEEFDRALAHMDAAVAQAQCEAEDVGYGVRVRYRPQGCVALITPWNNPLAIPVGKIAPALMFGNSVVWKPSPHATRTARALLASLCGTQGAPDHVVTLVEGDEETVRRLILDKAIDTVSLTGGPASGRMAAALCAIGGKPLQAELGGNNAHVVLSGADLPEVSDHLARAAFGFSGQRCTAVRRIIVVESVYSEFLRAFVAAVEKLPIGRPENLDTVVGPLLSAGRGKTALAVINRATAAGARLVAGGVMDGATLWPTILECADPAMEIVQRESFAPIVVMLKARDARDALQLANAVPQGLLAGISGGAQHERQFFLDRIDAGIVRLSGPPRIDAGAPFGGWKASGFGPPEHGRWDREFYARPQAVYDTTMVTAS